MEICEEYRLGAKKIPCLSPDLRPGNAGLVTSEFALRGKRSLSFVSKSRRGLLRKCAAPTCTRIEWRLKHVGGRF